jgi:hypothetical protein
MIVLGGCICSGCGVDVRLVQCGLLKLKLKKKLN